MSRDLVTSQRKERASHPVSLRVRIEAGGKVEGEAGHVTVGHHFEYDILVAITECRAEGVGGVGGGGSVEHHRPLGGVEQLGDVIPLCVGRNVHGLLLTAALQLQGELGPVVPGTGYMYYIYYMSHKLYIIYHYY